MPKRKAKRASATEIATRVGKETLDVGTKVATGAVIAQTAPYWAPPLAISILIGLAIVVSTALVCGGVSGITTFVLTGNFNTASIIGLVGVGVGALPLPVVIVLIVRRVRRHRLYKYADPHLHHVKKHVKTTLFSLILGWFGK